MQPKVISCDLLLMFLIHFRSTFCVLLCGAAGISSGTKLYSPYAWRAKIKGIEKGRWVEFNIREERKERWNVEAEQQEIIISLFSIP